MQKNRETNEMRGLMGFGILYAFLYCMLSSNVLLSSPILGGGLYLAGYIAVLFMRLRRPVREKVLSPSLRRTGTILLSAMLALVLALTLLSPTDLKNANLWRLHGLVLCLLLRDALMRYSLEKSLLDKRRAWPRAARMLLIQAGFLVPVAVMLLCSGLPADTVWALVGGYVLSGLMARFSLDQMWLDMRGNNADEAEELELLQKAHAYRMFQNAALGITAALQITQILTYAYIAVSAEALILCMGIALVCSYGVCLLSDAVLRRAKGRQDPQAMMICGLVCWLGGLMIFVLHLEDSSPVGGYISLALCTGGATACVRALTRMEADMRRVAAFSMGHVPGDALDRMQHVRLEFAALLGQLAALIGLALIGFGRISNGGMEWGEAFRSFSPLLIFPALLLVAISLVFALRFPLTQEHISKLRRYMELQEAGKENGPLRDQLEKVVVLRSLKHYGVKLIIAIMRPFYWHKIIGKGQLKLDKDTPCVFVCNHGEIYGPIVTNLYVPFSFRPWVTYEMVEKEAVADRMLNGIWKDQKWLPPKLCRFVAEKIAAPFLSWIMRSVDSIPVYHDNPRKLMQTFRETTAAMQAGDNILLFPENAATSADGRYQKEGVSEFFTGFTMIGQLYYNKTGKCPLFVPLYANKNRRTITFGTPTRYDASLPANAEKERLCNYLRNEMLRLAAEGEEKQS